MPRQDRPAAIRPGEVDVVRFRDIHGHLVRTTDPSGPLNPKQTIAQQRREHKNRTHDPVLGRCVPNHEIGGVPAD